MRYPIFIKNDAFVLFSLLIMILSLLFQPLGFVEVPIETYHGQISAYRFYLRFWTIEVQTVPSVSAYEPQAPLLYEELFVSRPIWINFLIAMIIIFGLIQCLNLANVVRNSYHYSVAWIIFILCFFVEFLITQWLVPANDFCRFPESMYPYFPRSISNSALYYSNFQYHLVFIFIGLFLYTVSPKDGLHLLLQDTQVTNH